MLPPLDANGVLPPGVHPCTLDELLARFGHGSATREAQAQELTVFIEWARGHGVRRILVNGSFVTAKAEPNDVDIVVLPAAEQADAVIDAAGAPDWPFLQVLVAADEVDFQGWATEDFATDREGHAKGVVEIEL